MLSDDLYYVIKNVCFIQNLNIFVRVVSGFIRIIFFRVIILGKDQWYVWINKHRLILNNES